MDAGSRVGQVGYVSVCTLQYRVASLVLVLGQRDGRDTSRIPGHHVSWGIGGI